jgi:hypothetical protein
MNMFRKIWQWVRQLFARQIRYRAAFMDESPDRLKRDIVYLIGDKDAPWAASFICPCECGEVISISLIETDSPTWTVEVEKSGAVTIAPSVWRQRGCKSHFFIHDGCVIWS